MNEITEDAKGGEEMTEEMLKDAIGQMQHHCNRLTETDYHSVSARGILYTLGFNSDEADEVIRYLHAQGFNYCLDPMFPSNGERTPDFACYWGPDQLLSRINCSVPWDWRVPEFRYSDRV